MRKNILITGLPHSGKSTLLEKVVANFRQGKVGFITKEILEDGQRTGFAGQTHSGETEILASVYYSTPFKVSRYGVSIENLISLVLKVEKFNSGDLLYLDEIGEMQLTSQCFRDLVAKYLSSPNICLATISSVYDIKFVEDVKARQDAVVIEITPENREAKGKFILALIGKMLKAKRYIDEPDRFSIKHDKAAVRGDHKTRHLDRKDGLWYCDCDFFLENKICSHSMAVEELAK